MRLKSVTIKPTFIEPTWETRNSQGDYEEQSHKFKEAPLPVFDTCIQDLNECVQIIMGVTSKWMETVKVIDFSVKRTEAGVRSMAVKFRKGFKQPEVTKEYSTPAFRIDPPENGEDDVPRAVSLEQASQCVLAIEAVEAYINGDRLQMTLEGVEKSNTGADPKEGDELNLSDPAEESNKDESTQPKKPTRASRKKKPAAK